MKQRVLICGMGVIGSIYALRLAKAGCEVTGLARGKRLDSLRARGLTIHNIFLDETETVTITLADTPPRGMTFDIVLVVVRSGQIMAMLDRLRGAEISAQAVVVIGNNLEDLAAQAVAVGGERFVPGFGSFGGYREDGVVHYLDGRTEGNDGPERRTKTTLGVIDESARPALETAKIMFTSAGLPVVENKDMHAWFLYHAALVFPMAGAIYATGGDQKRFCRTRDAVVLGIRACHECCRALRALGLRMQPKSLKGLTLMPEWALASLLSKRMISEAARVAMFGHANAPGGRDEIGGQASVLDEIIRGSGKPLIHWKRLLPYFNTKTGEPLIPDGSRDVRLRVW